MPRTPNTGGEAGRGFPMFRPTDEREVGVWPACPSAPFLQAGLPFLHIWLRLWVYGPHGRKFTIAVLTETRKEAVFAEPWPEQA